MADYDALVLKAGEASLELVPEFGGLINGLRLTSGGRHVELISGLASRADMESNNYYRGVVLYPSLNRLDGGRYSLQGQHYQLPVNEVELNNNLHGFLYTLKAEPGVVKEAGGWSEVVLKYPTHGEFEGYPFKADVAIEYRLDENNLTLTFRVVNRHHAPVPVALGWHPYLCINTATVDTLLMQTPAVSHALVDERMLPTGEFAVFEDFNQPAAIGGRQLDHCLKLQPGYARQVSTRLWSEQEKLGLEVWQDTGEAGYNFIQVCIPPDRKSIAIEPTSCGINAFNTGDGLIMLEPEQEISTRCGVRLIDKL